MNLLLEKRLEEIYPEFFSELDNYESPAVCCSVGNGWYPLVAGLLREIKALSQARGVTFRAREIKREGSNLGVHFNYETQRDVGAVSIAHLLSDAASFASKKLCEICGRQGRIISTILSSGIRCEIHHNFTHTTDDVGSMSEILSRPLSSLDLSVIPRKFRIERLRYSTSKPYKLTSVKYRSLESYTNLRVVDVELCEEIGCFGSYLSAVDFSKKVKYKKAKT